MYIDNEVVVVKKKTITKKVERKEINKTENEIVYSSRRCITKLFATKLIYKIKDLI